MRRSDRTTTSSVGVRSAGSRPSIRSFALIDSGWFVTWPSVVSEPRPAAAPATPTGADPQGLAAARGAIQQTRTGGPVKPDVDQRALADAAASRDDPDADSQGLDSAELLRRTLGAEMIEEIEHR